MATSYNDFMLNLLKVAFNNLKQHEPFNRAELSDIDTQFIEAFEQVVHNFDSMQGDRSQGEALLSKLPIAYPDLVPLIPRDLFWYFGGSCLHYMPDDEIAVYQTLDEAMYEHETKGSSNNFNYEDMRAKALGLN
ncbi:MAG: PA2817 family protein [Pontibacterium sp.]